MQLMGNSRARAVYEANLPDGFMRPQSDQTLEQFIRAKYERKKYVAKEWVSQKPPDFPEGWYELVEAEKQKKDLRKVILPSHTGFGGGGTQTQESGKSEESDKAKADEAAKAAANRPKPQTQTPVTPVGGLDKSPAAPAAAKTAPKSAEADLLGLDMGQPQANGGADILGLGNVANTNSQGGASSNASLFADTGNAPSGSASSDLAAPAAAPEDKSKMTKDSIMALFNSAPPPMPQQQQQQPQGGQPQQQQNMFGGASNMFPTHNGAAAGELNI